MTCALRAVHLAHVSHFSCSESDDNSSVTEEAAETPEVDCACNRTEVSASAGSMVCCGSGVGVGEGVGTFEDCLEAENDVDDETMSGDNDVFNSNPGHNPSSLQVVHEFISTRQGQGRHFP